MVLVVKTDKLQEMVGKVIRCASDNKLIPVTSLMNIKVVNNTFTLATTDGTNYFYVSLGDKVGCEDFEISVNADLFAKLIQKTTSENITLTIDGEILVVKGNGEYKIGLAPDPNGGVVKFDKMLPDAEPQPLETIKRSIIDKAIQYNKPSLAVDATHPSLTCYYAGDRVVTSNNHIICSTDIEVFKTAKLVSPQIMELLSILSEENINVYYDNEKHYTLYWTATDTIYAPDTVTETFPLVGVDRLMNGEFPSSCKVSKDAILTLLDRLALFVDSYDNKAIYLTFTPEGIMFKSKKSSGVELVPFIESTTFAPYTCIVDIEMFRAQVSTQTSDEVTLSYGNNLVMKMQFDKVTQLVALLTENVVGGSNGAE